jgi:hypothetical protein
VRSLTKKRSGYAGVGQTLGHQLEHLALAVRQLCERSGVAAVTEHSPDDVWYQRRAAACDTLGRIEKLLDGEYAVLQEVAEASECHELDGVIGLDVLGEQQYSHFRRMPR